MQRAAAVLLLALCGCVTGRVRRERALALENDLALARKQRADQCAPRDLAVAEANLRFAQIEIEQGDGARAEEHLATAQRAARKALDGSQQCGAVSVLIREQPKAKVGLKDSDGDGVPDVEDLCPDIPGPAENHGCPITADRDGDGVTDDIDRCPNIPGPKDNFGCPWPDRDGDGVPDQDDACPDVPGPKENRGCPLEDRDHDGVPDKDDRCPDEPGPKENQGCPRKQTLIIVRKDRIELKQQVHFAPNRSRILKDSDELLRQVARALKDAPGVTVRIEGHTDYIGSLERNMTLSQERANAVKQVLVRRGVQPGRLIAEGFGPKRPVAPNTSRAGRAANRRVEFRIVEPGSSGKASGEDK